MQSYCCRKVVHRFKVIKNNQKGVFSELMNYICDMPCGHGKSTAAINMIKTAGQKKRFLYITPYLEEVARVKKACRRFAEPGEYGGKLKNIKDLLSRGKSVVSTHALFQLFDGECVEIIRRQGYTLILDEVVDVIDTFSIPAGDVRYVTKILSTVDKNGRVIWQRKRYDGTFNHCKKIAQSGNLYYYGGGTFITMFSIDTFKAFKDVYVLTFMFKTQMQALYFQYHNVPYVNIYVKGDYPDCEFTHEVQAVKHYNYKELITFSDNKLINSIGEKSTALSKSWYVKNDGTDNMDRLKKNMHNFFFDRRSDKNMWTTFKDYHDILKGKGYTKGFAHVGLRATNELRNKVNLAYMVNIYLNPYIAGFFTKHGVEVDNDAYALSELVQWLFRSAIRDGQPVTLYIPSSRMRKLLQDWIDAQ